MPESAFEGGPPGLTGTINAVPLDPEMPGTTPYIIQTDNRFEVQVDWVVKGIAVPYLGGRWHLRLFLHPRDGVPNDGKLGDDHVPYSAYVTETLSPPARTYRYNFKVPANTISEGVYQMTVVLTYDNGGPPLEMAGFAEIPFIQFYVA